MATRLELRNRVKGHLGSVITGLFTDPTLDLWLDEGLRRCAPVLLDEVVAPVDLDTSVGRMVSLPPDVVYVTRAYCAEIVLPAWRQFAGQLLLEKVFGGVGPYTVTIEYLGSWSTMVAGDTGVCPLAEYQTDTVVFYACARAFRQLASNRADYRKYSTVMNNNVDMEDLERLGDFWQLEFEKVRLESRTHRQILFEKERQGGGAMVVGNADLR